MKINSKVAFAAGAAIAFLVGAMSFHNPLHAQAAAQPPVDELVRYGPLIVHSKDIVAVTREEQKKVTTFYVIPAPGQPPLKIDYSGDDSQAAWNDLQQPPVSIPMRPAH
ncbi:MAG TPA: hypothetical protein VL282_16915 [Tepidisphaeraceae bacterium]|jgi:hypothetical protein|nr:hypothetical protein [Tepidisphaeraceae bacterium]